MPGFKRIAAGMYRSTNLVPVEIHKSGSGRTPWVVAVIGTAEMSTGDRRPFGYEVQRFETLTEAQSFALPLISHPQGLAVASAAKLADDAARSFTYDADSEDADSAAWRAADILDAASKDGAAVLCGIVFGSADDADKQDAAEYRRIMLHGNPGENWTRFRELGKAEMRVRGIADVAYVLVSDAKYADIMRGTLAKLGAAGTTAEHGFQHGLACLDALRELEPFTFGAMALDGRRGMVEQLRADAARYAADAMADAAWCARADADGLADTYEVGMPRAE